LSQKYYLPILYNHLKDIWTRPGLMLVGIGLFLLPVLSARGNRMERLSAERAGKAPWLFHWWLLGAGGLYYARGIFGRFADRFVSLKWAVILIRERAQSPAYDWQLPAYGRY